MTLWRVEKAFEFLRYQQTTCLVYDGALQAIEQIICESVHDVTGVVYYVRAELKAPDNHKETSR